MKYVVVFETDDKLDNTVLLNGVEITGIETAVESIPVKSYPIQKLPPHTPCNDYNFESYTNGIAKGINYILDKLEGKNGEYDFTDLIPTKEV